MWSRRSPFLRACDPLHTGRKKIQNKLSESKQVGIIPLPRAGGALCTLRTVSTTGDGAVKTAALRQRDAVQIAVHVSAEVGVGEWIFADGKLRRK